MDVLVRGCGRDDRDLSPHPRGCKVRRVFSLTRITHRESNSILVPVVLECTITHPALRRGRVRLSACKSTSALWNIRTFRQRMSSNFAVNRLRAGPGSRRTVYSFLLLIGCEKHCGDSVCCAACGSKDKFQPSIVEPIASIIASAIALGLVSFQDFDYYTSCCVHPSEIVLLQLQVLVLLKALLPAAVVVYWHLSDGLHGVHHPEN